MQTPVMTCQETMSLVENNAPAPLANLVTRLQELAREIDGAKRAAERAVERYEQAVKRFGRHWQSYCKALE